MTSNTTTAKELTFIVPTYNMEAYLGQCIDSVLGIKDVEKIDLIIVNDGSKDRSLQIAREYEQKMPGVVRVVDKENGNWGSCVNAGLAVTRGRYVKILDADDYVEPDALQKMVESLANCTSDLVITPYRMVFSDGSIQMRDEHIFLTGEISLADFQRRYDKLLFHHEICWRTDMLRTINYTQMERVYYSDQQWVINPLAAIESICILPYNVYQYRMGRPGQSVSVESRRKHYTDEVDVRIFTMKRLAEIGYKSDVNKAICDWSVFESTRTIYKEMILGPFRDRVDDLHKIEANLTPELNEALENDIILKFFHYLKPWREGNRKVYLSILSLLFNTRNKIMRMLGKEAH